MNNYIFNLDRFQELQEAVNKCTYNELISFFKQFNKQYFDNLHIYSHIHHIIPESEGGTDKDGLICLPYRYHIKAHWLRAEEMMRNNNKLAAYKNYKAVRFALRENCVPKSIQQLEQKLDYVCKAIQKEKELKKDITYKWMSKEDICMQVYSTDIEQYLKNGWELRRQFKNPKGKIWITNGIEQLYLDKNIAEQYLNEHKDWYNGMNTKGIKRPQCASYSTKSTKWMNKNGIRKAVKLKDIDQYIKEGWVMGSASTTNKGKHWKWSKNYHWYTNGKENKLTVTCPEGFHSGRTI